MIEAKTCYIHKEEKLMRPVQDIMVWAVTEGEKNNLTGYEQSFQGATVKRHFSLLV